VGKWVGCSWSAARGKFRLGFIGTPDDKSRSEQERETTVGMHGSYNINFELARLHQHQLRDERAEDRLTLEAGNPPAPRSVEHTTPANFLARSLRMLAQRCRLPRKSIATAE